MRVILVNQTLRLVIFLGIQLLSDTDSRHPGRIKTTPPSDYFYNPSSLSLTDRCPIALVEYLEQHPSMSLMMKGIRGFKEITTF